MANDVKLKGSKPISENLSTITVGDEGTCLEISDSNGARVTGDLEVTGDITGNIKDMVLPDVTIDPLNTNNIVSTDLTIDDSGVVTIDKDYTDTTAADIKGLHVDVDRTGDVSTGTDTATGIDVDVNHTGASGGIIVTTGIDLDVVGDTGGTSAGIGFDVNVSGADTCTGISIDNKDGGFDFINRSSADVLDFFTINTIEDGETTLTTVENGGGSTAHLNMVVDGNFVVDSHAAIELDSGIGDFIAKKAGTEFSAANSAYAGMILGYTKIQNDSTTSGHAHIEPDATMTVLQTAQGTDVSVTFVAPPSGNVEISMLCNVYASSRTLEFALSDNASFNEINETNTYDAGAQSSDETDINMTYVSFVNTGLTAGTSYERWIGAAETLSGTAIIRHGRNRTTGFHYPPIIVKAIALPATITTGE